MNEAEVVFPLLDPSVGKVPVPWAASFAVTGWDLGRTGAGGCTGCSRLHVAAL